MSSNEPEGLHKIEPGSQAIPAGDAPSELTVMVDELLNSLSTKFSAMSSELFTKMDDMSRRLDNLETALQSNNPPTKR